MTTDTHDIVRQHYQPADSGEDLVVRVDRLLAGLGDGPLTAAQLAPLDQFHVRGLVATAEMAQLIQPQPTMKILDAGSGLGGPSRYLAETFGCTVVGVDLTPSYVELSRRLAQRSSAHDRLSYQVGDVAAMPLADGQFDLVWTQHVMMNIRDRAAAYAEFHRVLKPGGRMACYDVIASDAEPEIVFPVPWASDPTASHLLTRATTIAALDRAGFVLGSWTDVTAVALNWFAQATPPVQQPLSLGAVMGPRVQPMVANLSRNLKEGKVQVAMGVFTRRPA